MTDLQAQLAGRGIDERIIATLVEFAQTHPVIRCITESDGFRFSLDPHYHAAVYPHSNRMDIPLDPTAARSAAAHYGLEEHPRNSSTAYIRVPAGYLDTDTGRGVALELLDAAWSKVAAEPPWDFREGRQTGTAWGHECPNCRLSIPKTGVCDDCGWSQGEDEPMPPTTGKQTEDR